MPPPDPAVAALIAAETAAHGKAPWDCLIDVYLQAVGPPPVFQLESILKTSVANRLMFPNRRRPGFVITFRLHDVAGLGYLFPDRADLLDAVWSRAGDVCPLVPVHEVFRPLDISANRLELTVYNENPDPAIGNFRYTLNVVNAAGNRVPLDPGGADQNGNRS